MLKDALLLLQLPDVLKHLPDLFRGQILDFVPQNFIQHFSVLRVFIRCCHVPSLLPGLQIGH